jgi:hypothetical protein
VRLVIGDVPVTDVALAEIVARQLWPEMLWLVLRAMLEQWPRGAES